MQSYIEFARNYLEERGIKVHMTDEKSLIFYYNDLVFLFILNLNFPFSLAKIIMKNDNKDYPHFIKKENIVHLCLGYDSDYNLYMSSAEEIISETLEKFFRLLNLTKRQQKKEFFKEFVYFWNKRRIKDNNFYIFFNPGSYTKEIRIEETYREKKRKFSAFYEQDTVNEKYRETGTKRNGIYLPLENINYLSPFSDEWDVDKLINQNISEENYGFLKNYMLKKDFIYIIFSLFLENGFEIMFSSKFKFKTSMENSLLYKIKNELIQIESFSSTRIDSAYLCQRIGITKKYLDKKVAVVGCGSLGSYVANEISKIGIKSLSLFDYDSLSPENSFRHILGIDDTEKNKANGLKKKLELNFPHLCVLNYDYEITCNNFYEQNFEELDLLVFSIGDTTNQLRINDLLLKNKFSKPVLYTWLDPFGVGCHALLVDYSKKGCYKCLSLDENGEFSENDKITFSKNLENMIYEDGCGGSFNPYGNTVLLKGTAMIMNIVKNIFDGKKYEKNPLFSVKNYFEESISYTERFFRREDELYENYEYIVERCECCDK